MLIVWIVVIFVLTGYPKLEAPKMKIYGIDKLYHFVVFFILGLIAIRLMSVKGYFLLGIGVVLLAEFQQLIIPGRDFEVLDILAGAIALIVSFFIFRHKGVRANVSET